MCARRAADGAVGHPRAHVLTARTLEICEDLGLGDALRQIAPPLERWRRFRYCDRVDGADYAVADHGAAPAWANLEAASDQRVQHISQPVFEALLRRAVADADVETRYGRRVVDVGLDDGVACVLDDGATLDAEYLVAADGPRGPRRGSCSPLRKMTPGTACRESRTTSTRRPSSTS